MTEPTPPPLADDEEIIEGGPWIEDSPATAARALFLGILLLMAGNGLQGSLIGVRSETEGFSVTVAGFVMAAYFAGFLAGSRTAETLIAQVGHIRVFAGKHAKGQDEEEAWQNVIATLRTVLGHSDLRTTTLGPSTFFL